MPPQLLVARALRRGAVGHLVRAELEEPGVERRDQRDVETVEPDHRRGGGVVVLVPPPSGGEQQVAATHRHWIAVDDRPHPFAVEHEAERTLRVAVGGGDLFGPEVLHGRPQRRRCVRFAGDAGVGIGDGAALAAAADRNQLSGAFGEREHVRPSPHVRHGARPRLARHQVAADRPERHQTAGSEVGVQPLQGDVVLRVLGRRHRISMTHPVSVDTRTCRSRGARLW